MPVDLPTDAVGAVSGAVAARLRAVLDAQAAAWAVEQPDLAVMFDEVRDFTLAGGKRLRPAFCHWGAVGAGYEPDPALLDACTALELLHAFALIHDDVMDGSATRRGRPSVHTRFTGEHEAGGWQGEARRCAEGLAILAGDLAFVLADSLVDDLPPPARAVWHELRVELVAGQWVDLVGAARADRSPARARWVARYKSGRYTVERPLHLGAAIAGAPALLDAYSAFGEPLGEAFQLRDDVLGVYGDPAETGKPSGDDLREGKPTLLLALAAGAVSGEADAEVLARIGRPDLDGDDVTALRELFERTGARAAVEQEISGLVERALAALEQAPIDATAKQALAELADRAAWRDS